MTGPSIPASQAAPQDTQPSDLHREQLSAMMDGMLSNDESRFLLRRMQHDAELAGSWERWQLYGDALRGQAGRALPADFNKRISRAIAADSARIRIEEDAAQARSETAGQAATAVARRPLLRWGGGAALAASMALAAVMVVRGPGDSIGAPSAALPLAAATSPAASFVSASAQQPPAPAQPMPAPADPAPAASSATSTLAAGATAATLVAVASAGASREKNAGARRNSVRAAEAAAQRRQPALIAERGSLPPVEGFGPQSASDLVAKPWPRSLLQDDGGSARVQFNAGGSAVHPSFQPRIAPDAGTAPDGASAPAPDAQAAPATP